MFSVYYKYQFVEISTKNPENFQTTCRGLMWVCKVLGGRLFQNLKKMVRISNEELKGV
jgi:hypothetical protein